MKTNDRKLQDPDKIQQLIDNYFAECDQKSIPKQIVQKGEIITVNMPWPYTMAGLARCLDVSREALNNYQSETLTRDVEAEDPEMYRKQQLIVDAIMRARERIHEQNVNMGLLGCHDSRISALNLASNYGYSIKQDIQASGDIAVTVRKFTDSEDKD